MDFGDKLKEIRKNEGLSQEQLAERIGVSRQAITKWETGRGLPDVENMVILAEIFKMTLDELVLQEKKLQEKKAAVFESETVYDIDCGKHFDIHMGSARKIVLCSGTDEKLHVKLESEVLENLNSLFKIKLDEKNKKIDIDCLRKKGISRYETEDSVDVIITLPENYTNHCELAASTKELIIEGLKLQHLEYDGDAKRVLIQDCVGSLEFTSKTDYDITIEGVCTQLDINQWMAKTVVHVADLDVYKVINKGRKCNIYYQKNGNVCDEHDSEGGEYVISVSGIGSELLIDCGMHRSAGWDV